MSYARFATPAATERHAPRPRLGLIAVAAAGFLYTLPAAAPSFAEPAQESSALDLSRWERRDESDLPATYRRWLDDVDAILTTAEREIFLRLPSDERRDAFVERFWRVRDPSPGTPENEYYNEYQRRLEYVDRMFGRDTPRRGRETDRGRMYLLLGEPLTIKRLENTRLAVPAEIWWYQANPRLGIPPFFYLAFFRRNGVGELRLYSPLMDGPERLLNAAGQQLAAQSASNSLRPTPNDGRLGAMFDVLLEVDPELAQVALSFLPNDVGALSGGYSNAALRSEVVVSDIEAIPYRIMPDARWAHPLLTGEVEAEVRFDNLPVHAGAVVLVDPSGEPFLHFGVMTEGARLNLDAFEEQSYVTFEVAGVVRDAAQNVITGVQGAGEPAEKVLQADLEPAEASRLRRGPLVFLDRIPIAEGEFEFDIVLENNVSREYGRETRNIGIPYPRTRELTSSAALLLWAVRTQERYDALGEHFPFQVGRHSMVPALDNTFWQDQGIYLFRQIYVPRSRQERVRLTYRLEGRNDVVVDRTEYANPANADAFGTLDHGTYIDTSDLPPGDYTLTLDVIDDTRPPERHLLTLLAAADDAPAPFIYMLPGPPPSDPRFALDRARQLRSLGRPDEAIAKLDAALARTDDWEYVELQVELLLETSRFERVRELLEPLLVDTPNDVTKLRIMASASTALADHGEAIRYYERMRIAAGEDSPDVLNPLAAAYIATEQIDRARDLLRASLQLNPRQPQVIRMLEELRERS